jgi:hypothetical protein
VIESIEMGRMSAKENQGVHPLLTKARIRSGL